MNHRGGEEITAEELGLIHAPPPTQTWYPIKHSDVLSAVEQTLHSAGYLISKQRLSVSNEGHRFFGVLDLQSRITDGITLAVGVRNSTDKSFPIGMCCGQRVFVCDNLAFTSEVVISKRHTRFGEERYREGIAGAVASLGQYQEDQRLFIQRLRSWELSRTEADSIILQSYEEDLIGARQLPLLIQEWRNPTHDDFRPQNGWSLWNAFTHVLGRTTQATQPAKAALTTIRLQRLFSPKDTINAEFTRIEERSTATAV